MSEDSRWTLHDGELWIWCKICAQQVDLEELLESQQVPGPWNSPSPEVYPLCKGRESEDHDSDPLPF